MQLGTGETSAAQRASGLASGQAASKAEASKPHQDAADGLGQHVAAAGAAVQPTGSRAGLRQADADRDQQGGMSDLAVRITRDRQTDAVASGSTEDGAATSQATAASRLEPIEVSEPADASLQQADEQVLATSVQLSTGRTASLRLGERT